MRTRLSADERRALEHASAQLWAAMREAAHEAFGERRTYRYYDGHAVHDCRDMTTLASVTRNERQRDRVRWREDG